MVWYLRRTPPSSEALRHSGGESRRCTSATVTYGKKVLNQRVPFSYSSIKSLKKTYLVFAGGTEQGQPTGHWAKHVKRADQSRANGDVFVTVSLLAHSYYKKINQSTNRSITF